MAANAPDVDLTTLISSSQIFSPPDPTTGSHAPSYTLPQIRSLHKQIHLAIDDKKARLRTQVGGSYRELLGTADAIVRMRGEMDDVQGILGTMGARCGRGVVGSKVSGLAKFAGEREGIVEDGRGKASLGAAARGKLLAGCVLVLGKMLRGLKKKGEQAVDGETLMTAAKVSVLGRLLIKSFEENRPDPGVKAAVQVSVQIFEKLRRRLRKSIDNVLENVGELSPRDLVLKALGAYSLATHSGARDVVRHFLDVRGNAMASVFDVEEQRTTMDVVKGLELYTKTVLDVQFLVPNKLSEALLYLKREALLSDSSLRGLEGLRLDIYERWCSEAIQRYKPAMRHDDLDGKQAVEMLTKWSTKGSEVLLSGLAKTLERTTDFKVLTDMRTEVLQLWIRDGGKARGFDPSVMLDKLRQTINTHVMSVLDAKVHKLRLVGSEVASTLEVWRAGVTDTQENLWNLDGLDMDLHHSAGSFAQDVIGRLYGRNDAVARAVTGYKSWASVIDDVEEVVEQLKRQRWDNDVDEIEDEETIDQRQQALSRDDPAQLQSRLGEALAKAFKELEKQLSSLWEKEKDGENSGKIAMYLVRILRDIRAKLPKLPTVRSFGLEMVPSLQEKIASTVVIEPVIDFADNSLTRKLVVGRSLWEGNPELPTSPSPGVFRLLRNLSLAMSDAGTDLWSPSAVSILKKLVGKELSSHWTKALEAHLAAEEPEVVANKDPSVEENKSDNVEPKQADEEKPTAEGAASGEGEDKAKETRDTADEEEGRAKEQEDSANEVEEKELAEVKETAVAERPRNDLLIQWLFDISMLRCPISSPDASDELKELEEAIWKETKLEDASLRQRLNRSSHEYWKRSALLFGLLG
ncbi:hypothetical protein N0V93_005612 [Gnomoniopsis smithogilvyi]|uniref:Conserved oligomeric Golgi complex subunit 1 n=1 Tax=Gnomoniopsis smithogilvyi TaxID=1191159 RepID=A0A9W8YWX2_9PEZI|nr:hypothetical protein N0V93_005612 [Gnomoniopsis smithogilvyi]